MTSLRKKITTAMAALMLLGAGGVATQAGFSSTTEVEASAKAGTVVVGVNAASVNFGNELKGNTNSDPQVVPIEYTGNLDATVSLRLQGVQITDSGPGTTGTGYVLEYADNASFTNSKTISLSDGDSPSLNYEYTVNGPSTDDIHLRLKVPNDNLAQNDTVKFFLHADASQN